MCFLCQFVVTWPFCDVTQILAFCEMLLGRASVFSISGAVCDRRFRYVCTCKHDVKMNKHIFKLYHLFHV